MDYFNDAYNYYLSMNPVMQIILGILFFGIIFSVLKKFIKFAISLTIFAILIIILYKLVLTV